MHFAESHEYFDEMINKLANLLEEDGLLFIRTASNLAIEYKFKTNDLGIAKLNDGKLRYLLTKGKNRNAENSQLKIN